jgi:hypothetical protein
VSVRSVDLDKLSHEDRQRIIADEPQPFGGVGEDLRWRDKSHHVTKAARGLGLAGMVILTGAARWPPGRVELLGEPF